MGINISTKSEEISIVVKDFIKTYVKNSGCKGVVIGLSGGIDSAVTAILCKQALGKNKVRCFFMPDETTPKSDYKHQELIVKKFDLNCETKDITTIVKEINKYCAVKPDKYALANMKARIRMTLLFEYV